MDRLKTIISHKFSGKRGVLYIVVGLLTLLMLVALAIPAVNNTISLIDSIFNSKYERYYMVAAGIVASALLCMAFENVFTIPVVKEDPRFRRGFRRVRHILALVVVSAGIRVLYALVVNPATPLSHGELSVWPLVALGIQSPWIYTIANIVLHTLSVLAVYCLAYLLCRRWNSAFASAMAIALWPNSLFATSVAGTQALLAVALFVGAMLMGLLAFYLAERQRTALAILSMVAMGIISGMLVVISFVGMVVPIVLIICAFVKEGHQHNGRHISKVKAVYAIGGFLWSIMVALGFSFLASVLTGESTIFSEVFTAGATIPEGIIAKISSVWGGDVSMVEAMMSNSIKPAAKQFASVYDSLYGSPLILKLVCQMYYIGMLFVMGRGIMISFRNGEFVSGSAVAVMASVLAVALLTIIAPNTQIYHMPAIALAMCLASLGFESVEPDYDGL